MLGPMKRLATDDMGPWYPPGADEGPVGGLGLDN